MFLERSCVASPNSNFISHNGDAESEMLSQMAMFPKVTCSNSNIAEFFDITW